MWLETIASDNLLHPDTNATALVLMGGGARTAYQAGVLQALAHILSLNANPSRPSFPFQILVGTSAGAINATYLASHANQGLAAFDALAQFWSTLHSHDVYELQVPNWIRVSKLASALVLTRQIRSRQAFFNSMPLVNTLHRAISLPDLENALQSKALQTLAVTASSYTSGVHWTFCHSANYEQGEPWKRTGRRAEFQPITIEHLMASSAIPFIFPAIPLWVDGHQEFFGDGSMRQSSPLSPALQLGAHKVLVIGVGQPERAGLVGSGDLGGTSNIAKRPSLSAMAGHAMASVFQDTLQSDVEQAQRVSGTLRQMPADIAAVMPYRPVDVLAIAPSESLDALAQQYASELPSPIYNALVGLGARGSPGGAALASYLLFEPGFTQALMDLGARDAMAKKQALLDFFQTDTGTPPNP